MEDAYNERHARLRISCAAAAYSEAAHARPHGGERQGKVARRSKDIIETISEVIDHIKIPDHVGDIVLWDNRCCMHYRSEVDANQPRILHRTTIKGEVPIAAS